MAKRLDTSTLCLEGELTIYNAADAKARLAEVLGRPGGLEVDLSAVTEVDSAGLQLLILARREADRLGKPLHCLGISPAVRETLDFCHLTGLLDEPAAGQSERGHS